MDEQSNMSMGQGNGSSASPIIGIIIILAIIILGGFYFWSQRANETMMTDEAVESINRQNNSDTAAAIEADLDATDIENLDAELNAS